MRNYEEAWRALEIREKAIDDEHKQPNISREWRKTLELEKTKVKILKKQLMKHKNSDGGRDKTDDKRIPNPQDRSEANEQTHESSNQEQAQAQARQTRQGRDPLRELEIHKWAERQHQRD